MIDVERYNKLKEKYELIPVCAEIFGGLPTPRNPAEIQGEKVITNDGRDVTSEYIKGAEEMQTEEKGLNIEIDYSEIKVGEKLEFPFNISKKYNRI